jgi:site-specific recombinase XerD
MVVLFSKEHPMFDLLFTYPSVQRRHREGPLAAERAAYLRLVAARGMAPATILRVARYCLCIAKELQRRSLKQLQEFEVVALADKWAARRVKNGRAKVRRWAAEQFGHVAKDFLHSCGRLHAPPARPPGRWDAQLADFLAAQQAGPWQSSATCRSGFWQVRRFLSYLEERGTALADVGGADIDSYFQEALAGWSRNSLHSSAKALRAWFGHAERRGWVRAGLAQAILLPRVYRDEGLPIGPTWEEVGRVLQATAGQDTASLRDHAILLLLAVYGLRSGEVRRLRLDDIDWVPGQILIVRSKSGRQETWPLHPRIGNALARYLRHGRPKSADRSVFLTLKAPHVPLSTGGLYDVVQRHLSKIASPGKGRGPHALRHACAQHLVDTGRTLKQVGDHLGHRSPDSTRIYAKVNLLALRRVAFNELGGLS